MSVMIAGTEEDHIMPLFDGYSITIEWGNNLKQFDGFSDNYSAAYRRVRLYDDKGELVAEMIEENPFKQDVTYAISKDPNVLI